MLLYYNKSTTNPILAQYGRKQAIQAFLKGECLPGQKTTSFSVKSTSGFRECSMNPSILPEVRSRFFRKAI